MPLIFHHLGLACADIAETLEFFRRNGMLLRHGSILNDPLQDADLCWVETTGGPPVELISGPVVAGLIKKGIHFYHHCWQTQDLEDSLADLQAQGALLISPAKPAVLFDGRRVAFLSTPAGLLELLEQR